MMHLDPSRGGCGETIGNLHAPMSRTSSAVETNERDGGGGRWTRQGFQIQPLPVPPAAPVIVSSTARSGGSAQSRARC
jgi:hypothetical protein